METNQLSKMVRTIAIVDDDAAVRKALMRLLKASLYDVRTFGRASEFIVDLAHHVPACALIDLQMPDMTGLELQQYLAGAGFKIPTIVITAYDEPDSRQRCIAAGAAAYLLKPLRKAALIAAIDAAIEVDLPFGAEDLRADDIGPEG